MTQCLSYFFFFNDTATTEIYTLSLHDALPISRPRADAEVLAAVGGIVGVGIAGDLHVGVGPGGIPAPQQLCRSEEHTSELQSRSDLVCRLLLEKKKASWSG